MYFLKQLLIGYKYLLKLFELNYFINKAVRNFFWPREGNYEKSTKTLKAPQAEKSLGPSAHALMGPFFASS